MAKVIGIVINITLYTVNYSRKFAKNRFEIAYFPIQNIAKYFTTIWKFNN